MGKNKTQKSAEERASKKSALQPAVGKEPGQINGETGKVNEQPVQPVAQTATTTTTPAATAPAPPQPSKQDQTVEKLKEGWTAKGVDLSKLTIKDDGKFKLLIVDQGWNSRATPKPSMRQWTGYRSTRSSRHGNRRRLPLLHPHRKLLSRRQ
jgi:hypothetical protein